MRRVLEGGLERKRIGKEGGREKEREDWSCKGRGEREMREKGFCGLFIHGLMWAHSP